MQDVRAANVQATQGVPLREFKLKGGYGFAEHLPYVEAKTAGVILNIVREEFGKGSVFVVPSLKPQQC